MGTPRTSTETEQEIIAQYELAIAGKTKELAERITSTGVKDRFATVHQTEIKERRSSMIAGNNSMGVEELEEFVQSSLNEWLETQTWKNPLFDIVGQDLDTN